MFVHRSHNDGIHFTESVWHHYIACVAADDAEADDADADDADADVADADNAVADDAVADDAVAHTIESSLEGTHTYIYIYI